MARSKLNKHQPSSSTRVQSRVTNGNHLPLVDGRTSEARRYKDLIAAHTSDAGGAEALSAAQHSIIRRAVCIQCELERVEGVWLNKGGATSAQLDAYTRAANTMTRLLEKLRLNKGRLPREVNPTVQLHDYISTKHNGHARKHKTPRFSIIEHEEDE